MKGNLGQECIKRGLLFFQDKIETIALDLLGKMTVSRFDPTFPPVTPENLAFHPNKNYIFEMNNSRAIRWKFHNDIFKIVDVAAT